MALYIPHSIFHLAPICMSGRKRLDPTTYLRFRYYPLSRLIENTLFRRGEIPQCSGRGRQTRISFY